MNLSLLYVEKNYTKSVHTFEIAIFLVTPSTPKVTKKIIFKSHF